MIHLLKYVIGEWKDCRAQLKLDLDVIQSGFNALENQLTGGKGTVQAGAIQGDSGPTPRYVANTGLDHAPYWDQIDLAASGVKNRLPFSHLPAASVDSILIGRGEPDAGNLEEILLGPNLSMTGNTLNATGSGMTLAQVAARVTLQI